MTKVRVLVVEDSLTVRRRLCEVLGTDPEIEIADEADNGKSAIELCREIRPDVVTMDMMLPVMSGLAATAEQFRGRKLAELGAGLPVGPDVERMTLPTWPRCFGPTTGRTAGGRLNGRRRRSAATSRSTSPAIA